MNTRNGDCSGYTFANLPPPTNNPNPVPDCVATQTGLATGQIRQAVRDRFGGTPCKTLNHWPQSASDPFPDPGEDPRYILLFIVDTGNFSGTGSKSSPCGSSEAST